VPAALSSPATLRCLPGPRADWCPPGLAERLREATYVAGSDSDRVGLRLQGPALERRKGELPSEGVVLGAVQLPPDGQPVVFLNDHPTTGGYPVVAVVVRADLARCAQVRPGDEVRFSPRPAEGWP
jgi:allophanate hydrolase subunit 2